MANKNKRRKAYRAGGITKVYTDRGGEKKAFIGALVSTAANIWGGMQAAKAQQEAADTKAGMIATERQELLDRRERIEEEGLPPIPGLKPEVSPTLDIETAAIPGRFKPVEDVSTEALDKQRELQSQKMSEAVKSVTKSAGTKGALGLGNLLRAGREGDAAIMKDQMEADERTRQLEKNQEQTIASMQNSAQMSKAGQEFQANQALSQATMAELSAQGAKEDALLSAEFANVNEQAQAQAAGNSALANAIGSVASMLPFKEGGRVQKKEGHKSFNTGGMNLEKVHLDSYYGRAKNFKNMANTGTVLNIHPNVVSTKQYNQGENLLPADQPDVTPGEFSHGTNPIDIVQAGEKIGEMTGGEVIMPNKNVNQLKDMLAAGNKEGVSNLMNRLITRWEKEAMEDSNKSLDNNGAPVQKAFLGKLVKKAKGALQNFSQTKVGGLLGKVAGASPIGMLAKKIAGGDASADEAAAAAVEGTGIQAEGTAMTPAMLAKQEAMLAAGMDPSMMMKTGMPGMGLMGSVMGVAPGGGMAGGMDPTQMQQALVAKKMAQADPTIQAQMGAGQAMAMGRKGMKVKAYAGGGMTKKPSYYGGGMSMPTKRTK